MLVDSDEEYAQRNWGKFSPLKVNFEMIFIFIIKKRKKETSYYAISRHGDIYLQSQKLLIQCVRERSPKFENMSICSHIGCQRRKPYAYLCEIRLS